MALGFDILGFFLSLRQQKQRGRGMSKQNRLKWWWEEKGVDALKMVFKTNKKILAN